MLPPSAVHPLSFQNGYGQTFTLQGGELEEWNSHLFRPDQEEKLKDTDVEVSPYK